MSGRATRNHWALFGNPEAYRVEAAVQDRDTDLWTSKGKPIAKGDRVIIWKGLGRGTRRGIVALGEVLSDPFLTADPDNDYWTDSMAAASVDERVRIRYVRPSRLPIWLDEDTSGIIGSLSVARSRGGTVFKVTPEQWERVVKVAGGWPKA